METAPKPAVPPSTAPRMKPLSSTKYSGEKGEPSGTKKERSIPTDAELQELYTQPMKKKGANTKSVKNEGAKNEGAKQEDVKSAGAKNEDAKIDGAKKRGHEKRDNSEK